MTSIIDRLVSWPARGIQIVSRGNGGLASVAAAILLGGSVEAQVCTPRPSGALWSFDGDSRYGALVRHVAPGEVTGTVFGTLSIVNGRVGKTFSFDGATTRLETSDNAAFNATTRMSVEFWMQSTGPQPETKFTILSKGHDVVGPNGWFVEGNTSTGRVGFGYGNGVNFTNFVQTTTSVLDGLWHHIAATFDTSLPSSQMKIYLDGVLNATRTTTDAIATNTQNFVVGRCNCGQTRWYRGNLDEPMTYNRALSATEIQAIVDAGGAGKCRFRLQQGQTQKLRATDHDPNTPTSNEFGNVVAADGDTIVVGDRIVTLPGFGTTGTASVYRRSGNSWVVEQRLLPDAPRDLLSLAIEGNRLVWGGLDHVLVFNRSGSTWTRETTIVVTPGSAHFGDDVDLSGDRFIAGMVGDTPPTGSGSARVYVRAANGTWSLQGTLRPSDPIDSNFFGGSVALEGDLALASTQFDDQLASNAGAVYAFRWNGSSWSEIAKILPWVGGSNGFAGDRFGASVALRGGMALIGAPGDDDGGSNAGAGYVMRWDGSAWQQEAKLVATDSKGGDSLGGRELFDADPVRQHVALDATGTLAILGAEGVDHVTAGEAAKAGAVYVFVREIRGGQPYWRERDKLLSTDNGDDGIVGQSVAVMDDFAVAGCNGFSLHAAYVWNIQNAPPVVTCPSDITVECTGPTGQVVTYSASATDTRDGSIPIFCTPRSGSTFLYGATTVSCTATDSYRESTICTFTVNVVDTTAPSITCPADRTVECTSPAGAPTSFSATATDICDPSPGIVCVPASGSTFGFGATTVMCTATDAAGNPAACSFIVTVVDTTSPVITCPSNQTLECTSPAGATATYSASATDVCDPIPVVACVPPSGSTFAFGTSTVNCTATDSASNASSCSFTVTVVDTTPPVITCAADQTLECTSPAGAASTFSASAIDVCDASPGLVCAPPSGSTFGMGTTTVTCTATDSSTNSASCSFTVTVVDTTSPSITCPADLTVECTSPAGAAATFSASAMDVCDSNPGIVCVPSSGSTFGTGTTTVTCTATDSATNASSCSFTVTVVDTTAPMITCPADRTVECTGPAGAATKYSPSVADACDPSPSLSCVPASGSTFPFGTTSVTCTATDSASNSSSCSFSVTIVDTTAPDLDCPGDIPIDCADETGADVSFSVTASDVCDAAPVVSCVPASGSHFPPGDTLVNCSAIDAAGNATSCSFVVRVRDQSCGAGVVNSGAGEVTDVLAINSTPGEICTREVTVPRSTPITVALAAAPQGPDPGRYVVWAWASPPTNSLPLTVGNQSLGCTVNPTPFHPGQNPRAFRCIRGGLPTVVCRNLTELRGSPARAPWMVTRTQGLSRALTLTFQGVLEDDGAANTQGYSVTNAVILRTL